MSVGTVFLVFLCVASPSTAPASVQVSPQRTHFFRGQSVSLSCEDRDGTVMRTTSAETRGRCGADWGTLRGSFCKIHRLFPWLDSGTYWCESTEGHVSQSVLLRVTDRGVLPETEGQTVSASLSKETPPSSVETPPSSTETPPSSQRPLPLALLCHLLVLCPYVVSTVLMVSLYRQVGPETKASVTVATQTEL